MSSWTHVITTSTGLSRIFLCQERWESVPPPVPGMFPQQQQVRVLQDTVSGEVFREWRSTPGGTLAPYDFMAMDAELKKTYGADEGRQAIQAYPPQHGVAAVPTFPKVGDVIDGWECVSWRHDGIGNTPPNTPPLATWRFVDHARQLTRYEERQASHVLRSWVEDERNMAYTKSYIQNITWTGSGNRFNFNTFPEAPAAGKDHNPEDDMAQRHDFTFPYTGGEIAASLERKAAALDARQTTVAKPDLATLKLVYPSYSDGDIAEVIKTKQREIDRVNEKLAAESAALRKEAIPYAKASKQPFEIDLEDIEFFGLNDDDAPAPTQKRKRRTKAEMEADAAQSNTAVA